MVYMCASCAEYNLYVLKTANTSWTEVEEWRHRRHHTPPHNHSYFDERQTKQPLITGDDIIHPRYYIVEPLASHRLLGVSYEAVTAMPIFGLRGAWRPSKKSELRFSPQRLFDRKSNETIRPSPFVITPNRPPSPSL